MIEGYNTSDPANCRYFYDGRCQYNWTDTDCQEEYIYAKYNYDYGYSSDDPNEYMVAYYSNVCEPFIPDYTL